MGNWVSNFNTNNKEDEEEKRIKKYEEEIDKSPFGYGLQDTEDLKEIKWWQYLVFDMRARLIYALIIGVLLGVAVPLSIFFIWFSKSDSTIYGSCLIKLDARFQCLINNAGPVEKSACIKANCCWEENDSLQFKCFHSFPSAYQYRVSNIQSNGSINGTINQPVSVQLDVIPNHPEKMTSLKVAIKWLDENHLNLQIFNPKDFPNKQYSSSEISSRQGSLTNGTEILVNYGDKDGYFFIQLSRNSDGMNETIFDTRLGPINSGNGFISFTTLLPSPYFFGLKGGEGISSKGTVTYSVVNGFENAELPFYMSLEDSGLWHGVLLETSLPFMMQVLQAPGIGFHLEGPLVNVNLHVFVGPEQGQVLEQLHSYLASKTDASPYVPPYWGLGLHLCRKSENGSVAFDHIIELNEIQLSGNQKGLRKIPYDSDCIDEDLRTPFQVDSEKFANIHEMADFLANNASKKIVLSQKVAFYWNETDIDDIQEILVMDKTNKSDIRPYVGRIDNKTVYYLDVFHPKFLEILSELGYGDIFGNISFSGLNIVENYPKNEEAIQSCEKPPTSFLQVVLLNGSSTTDAYQTNTSVWGSICPEMVHQKLELIEGSNATQVKEKNHFEVHNLYGLEALKRFREMAIIKVNGETGRENDSLLLSSSSGWTESSYYGGHNGMEVAFTWIGLRESLAHVLRQFILSPFSSTPICGSYLHNESPVVDNDLCLRWYQVALLLPFAHHNYGHGNVSRGPLDFPQRYQDYLNQAIRQRYTYAPYYYTLLMEYKDSFAPPIVPMSYYFNSKKERSQTFKLVDQFMIGKALMAAPIVKPDLNREAYFPAGKWYDIDGYVAWDNQSQSGVKIVTGHIIQTPLFLRAGYILPTLQNPQGNSIMESRKGNYTLLVGLLPDGMAEGYLDVDDGIHFTSAKNIIYFQVNFSTVDTDVIELTTTITASNISCDPLDVNTSTVINQIKFLGFPVIYNNITIAFPDNPENPPSYLPGDEVDTLRVYNLHIDWCTNEITQLNILAKIVPD